MSISFNILKQTSGLPNLLFWFHPVHSRMSVLLFTSFSKFSSIQSCSMFNCAVVQVPDLDCIFPCHLLTHNEQWTVNAGIELNEVRGATCKAVRRLSIPSEGKRQYVSHYPTQKGRTNSCHKEQGSSIVVLQISP